MFKKFLTALLSALVIFSIANVDKAEASNGKINIRVDYLEEGTNKKLANSVSISGDEGAFSRISIPQNLVDPYNVTKRDFSEEAKQLIANNKIYNNELVYQIYFTKKNNYQPAKPTVQVTGVQYYTTTTTSVVQTVNPVVTHVSGQLSVNQTNTTIKKTNVTPKKQVTKKPIRKPVGKRR